MLLWSKSERIQQESFFYHQPTFFQRTLYKLLSMLSSTLSFQFMYQISNAGTLAQEYVYQAFSEQNLPPLTFRLKFNDVCSYGILTPKIHLYLPTPCQRMTELGVCKTETFQIGFRYHIDSNSSSMATTVTRCW